MVSGHQAPPKTSRNQYGHAWMDDLIGGWRRGYVMKLFLVRWVGGNVRLRVKMVKRGMMYGGSEEQGDRVVHVAP